MSLVRALCLGDEMARRAARGHGLVTEDGRGITDELDNPAARMAFILRAVRNHRDGQARAAWARVLEVDPEDETTLHERLLLVRLLPRKMRDGLVKIPMDHTPWYEQVTLIEREVLPQLSKLDSSI